MRSLHVFCALGLAILVQPSVATADDWPAWRKDGAGVAAADVAPPVRWDASTHIRWATEIPGSGHSSPIVSGNLVLLTSAWDGVGRDAALRQWLITIGGALSASTMGLVVMGFVLRPKRSEAVARRGRVGRTFIVAAIGFAAACLTWRFSQPAPQTLRYVIGVDRDSGAIRWQTECAAGDLVGSTAMTSAATPTPVTDGKRIYAHFGRAGTYCLDFGGRVVWAHSEPAPSILYKAGSSPVLWNDLLIVTHDTDKQLYTVAFDKRDGTRRWTIERRPPTEGRRSRMDAYATPIVVHAGGRDTLVHDSYRHLSGYDPATGRERWKIPTDAEQVVTSPVAAGDVIVFAGECNIPIHMTAIRLPAGDDTASPETLWTSKRQVPVVSSPAIDSDRVYAVSKSGIVSCRDLATGAFVWRHRLPGRYYASVTIAAGRLYLSNLDGVTTVMAVGDEPRVLATNPLDGAIYASPAFVGGTLFLRTDTRLYAIEGE
ncbi:MAG TPA: PQQ-binding-like beta-propeller repeat protein [Phycisphaerae bacterium]|nr:PQQ-binding-like beta-propeller repeat protein [Phycisphaerae bacterium]HRW53414.1 PQQ-binding-like beta-propeller repeat protein [Phycisphaerae bacterium]